MKFYNFLNENDNLDKIINILKTKCRKNLKDTLDGYVIYKGMIFVPKSYFVDYKEKRKERRSKNTYNYYTIMFSEILDSWKDYPKRNKGIICSNSLTISQNYGKIFIVIPFDNTKIGVCSQDDIWHSFNKSFNKINFFGDLSTFNYKFFKSLDIIDDKQSIETFIKNTSLEEFLELIEIKNVKIDISIKNHYNKNEKLIDIYNDLFNLKKNDFSIVKKIKDISNKEVELWFDGSCVFIEYNKFEEIKENLKNEIL